MKRKSLVDTLVEVAIVENGKNVFEQAKHNFEHYEEKMYENKMTFEEYLHKVVAQEINNFRDYNENWVID